MRKNLLEMQWRSRCATYEAIEGNEAWLVTLGTETVASFDVAPGQLVDIRVHPDFQGRGIATKVIHHLQDRFETLKLNVAFGNPAVALYERCGFQITDRTPVGLIMSWSRLD